MEDRKLTGNKMFEMVKEECERILGNVHKPELEQNKGKKNGVLYYSKVDGNWGWNRSGNEKKDIKYVGEIENGNPNGQGTVTYANGNKYVGKWKDGKYNGQGTETFANGNKYVGKWKDGKRNGQGTVTYASGNKYAGKWKDGKRNGQGTVTYANGNKYGGKWKDGKYNGQGTLTLSNGLTFVGIFKYGEEWNGNGFNTKNKIIYRFVNGERKNQ
jgi:hypothetical protein